MELFHASNMIVENPVIMNRFTTLDFGTGFYTTINEVQAQEFALKTFLRRNHVGTPTINRYVFEEGFARRDLSFLEFKGPDISWLNFVTHNRKFGRAEDVLADIIIGPVANDDVFQTVTLYEAGQISADEAIQRFKVKKLFNQVLFCNARSLEYLVYDGNYQLEV